MIREINTYTVILVYLTKDYLDDIIVYEQKGENEPLTVKKRIDKIIEELYDFDRIEIREQTEMGYSYQTIYNKEGD